MRVPIRFTLALIVFCGFTTSVLAEPWAAPGDMRLRNDLQLLNDSGAMNIPLTAWPVAWGDVYSSLADVDISELSWDTRAAYDRVRGRAQRELDDGAVRYRIAAGGAGNPRIIRSFEDTPRVEGEVTAGVSWVGERFAFNLTGTVAANPQDGDELRPDGSYVAAAIGNWMLSAGWQERWWGPGRDGSLILGTNARPMPSIGIQRNGSAPFETKWLAWMGPWTLSSFMGLLDDERTVNNGVLWGLRGSFRPVRGLEIGITRTAQWCGDGRPCGLKTFLRVLNGNDNRGANVAEQNEPGNQLGGIDMRWSLPRQIPLAFYMQWIAEDTLRTGVSLRKWVQQVGVEHWGRFGDVSHRTHFEIANTACHLGAFGQGAEVANCAYNNRIFWTGYRYKGRSIGHPLDNDGVSYSLGSTLVQSADHTWNISLRHMEINRKGKLEARHTLSATPQVQDDVQVSHERLLKYGRIYAGIGFRRLDDELTGRKTSEASGFIRWSSQ